MHSTDLIKKVRQKARVLSRDTFDYAIWNDFEKLALKKPIAREAVVIRILR